MPSNLHSSLRIEFRSVIELRLFNVHIRGLKFQMLNLSLPTFLLLLTLNLVVSTGRAQMVQMKPDGPQAERLGQPQGYPACFEALTRVECRVGTWSGQLLQENRHWVKASDRPLIMPDHPASPPITWRWGFSSKTLDDFLDDTQTTGLLIIKDGQVIAERYQYDRKPSMTMRSFSMAKTITALLVGIAHAKGKIKSLDDTVGSYWPEIAESAYGLTTIRSLLRMSSGVPFRELYTWTPDDDIWVWGRLLNAPENRGRPELINDFINARKARQADQATRFQYASIETELLGRVLIRATGQTIAQLTESWLWQPMGAEGDAFWLKSGTDGAELTSGGFNASLRDYGRLGILLANDGVRDGVDVIPRDFLLDATEISRQPSAFAPKMATPYMGYGYQVWLLPNKTRTFVLQGIHGQHVFVQPASKIVMVQTSVNHMASGRQDNRPYQYRDALWNGVLRSLGGSAD
jgi:CubicO group peptidase (beta-lactamase class C family)